MDRWWVLSSVATRRPIGGSPAPALHFLDAILVSGFERRHAARYHTGGRQIRVDTFNEEVRAPLAVRRNLQTESQGTGVVLGPLAAGDPGFTTEPVAPVPEHELPRFDTSVRRPTLGELVLDLEEVGKVGLHGQPHLERLGLSGVIHDREMLRQPPVDAVTPDNGHRRVHVNGARPWDQEVLHLVVMQILDRQDVEATVVHQEHPLREESRVVVEQPLGIRG